MQMIYDSELFVVVHLQANAPMTEAEPQPMIKRDGFEIVDKKSGKGIYLDGAWAECFQKQIKAWQDNTPTQEEVDTCLDGYAQLAQNPIIIQ